MTGIIKYVLLIGLLVLARPWLQAQVDNKDAKTREEVQKKSMPGKAGSFRKAQANQVEQLLNKAEKAGAKEPKKALDYIAEALALSINENNTKGEAQSYRALGLINYQQGLFAKAVENYEKALTLFKSINATAEAHEVKKSLATALESNGEYSKALALWNEVQREAAPQAKVDNVSEAKRSMGRIYEKQGKEDLALENYQEVLKIEQKRGNDKGVMDANTDIGNIYLQQEKTQQALDYYSKSQNLATALSDAKNLTKSNELIGKVYRLEKRYDQELALRQQSIALHLKDHNQQALNDEYLEVAKLFIEQKNATAAIPYLQKSVTLSDQLGNLAKKSEAYRTLSDAYEQLKNVTEAMKSYKAYVGVVDVLHQQKEKELAGLLRFKEELSERQKKIESLEKDRQLNAKTIELLRKEQKLKEESMKKQLILIYALVAGLLLVFGASYLLYKSSQKRRIANQLLALKSLRSQMNPHFIFNALNSVNSFISQNDERSANKYLSEFSKLMRAVMENSQHDLVPLSTELRILELYLGLEHFRFREKFDYSFDVDPAVDADAIQIPPMLIQPYIENAVWHGLRYKEEKGFLAVKVTKGADNLVVSIEDNGIGRQRSQALKTANQKENVSTGLRNIESRLRIINEIHRTRLSVAIEDLNPADTSGTKVQICIPLHVQAIPV